MEVGSAVWVFDAKAVDPENADGELHAHHFH